MIALTLATSLAGCAAGTSSLVRTCPAIKHYTQAQRDRAADELDRLGYPSELSGFMADYADLRAQTIACSR